MVKIPDFEVEQWMDTYENTPGILNIAETCASSISLSQLSSLHRTVRDGGIAPNLLDHSVRMTYGAIRGSDELRRNIAALYGNDVDPITPGNVIVTQGAIAANHLVFYALIGPGDHVICVHPTYQQLYTVPATLGADVSLWEQRPEDKYMPDVDELEKLIKPNTKMIVINNPNNPTGTTIPTEILQSILAIARRNDLFILSDEAYSPLFHSLPANVPPPVSIITLAPNYSKTIVTSTMSKAWALAGIRLGWIATRDVQILARLSAARDYTTISVSQLDDQVARFALSEHVRSELGLRNARLARGNLELLTEFVEEYSAICSWVAPTAGTTAFLRFVNNGNRGQPVDDEEFCKDVLEKTGVLMVPGSKCFGERFRGYVRVGYVCERELLREALRRLGDFLSQLL
ncbi:PLP-dependent transferase [Xylaria sp. CBS 124048]|nr:PLP-dependent transferase [Xylaria sp. CBS 124048]